MSHGTGSSPVLADGKLIVQCDNEKESFLIALRREDRQGSLEDEADRADRVQHAVRVEDQGPNGSGVPRCREGPVLRRGHGQTALGTRRHGRTAEGEPGGHGRVCSSSAAVAAAGRHGGRPGGRWHGRGHPADRRAASAAAGSKPLFAVKPGATGDISLKDGAKSSDAVAWSLATGGPERPRRWSTTAGCTSWRTAAGCSAAYDAKTGKQTLQGAHHRGRGFTSSPWAYDGKIFCLDDSGTTHVVQAGPEFKLLGTNPLTGMCWATPAAGNAGVFLRTVDYVYCLRAADGAK